MLKVAKKYILAFPKEKEKEVVDLLEREGRFEIIAHGREEIEEGKEKTEKALQNTDYLISSLSFAISYLKPFAKKTSFLEKIKNPKIFIERGILKDFRKNEKILSLMKRVIKIEKDFDVLLEEKREGKQKLEELKKFGSLQFMPGETGYTFSLIVSFVQAQAAKFQEALTKQTSYIQEIAKANGKVFLLIIGLKDKKEDILALLEQFRGETVPFNFSHPPVKEKEIIAKSLKRIEEKVKLLHSDLSMIAGKASDLKIYHDFLTIQKTNLEIKERSLNSQFLNYLLFWGQEDDKKKIEQKLSKISSEITITETQPDKGEEAPVVLENNKTVRPFQYVTEIFGLPRSDEIDPTPYFALFFIVFFGICLTDAGYGLLLMLFTALPLIFLKNRFAGNKLLKLLFYGGISTFVMGMLFGSYFGVSAQTLKIPFLHNFKILDPIENTLLFMELSFFLGYLQLIFAQIVRIISGTRNRNKEMMLAGINWSLLYIFLGILVLGMKFPVLKNIGFFGTIILGCSLIFTESIGQRYFLKPLVGGVKTLQGLIGTISDILSYSRLMALGLATAVIALIVNEIAFLFGKMIPYFGWLIAVLILIGGHIFNLGINALGGFIHSGRLQFVEFFPKFLEGGGKRFQPTRSTLKYIKIED